MNTKEIFLRDDKVFTEVTDGEIVYHYLFFDGCIDSTGTSELIDAVYDWDNDEDTVLRIGFKMADIVDFVIEDYVTKTGALDPEGKPEINILRRELEEQIKRIDALEFNEE